MDKSLRLCVCCYAVETLLPGLKAKGSMDIW